MTVKWKNGGEQTAVDVQPGGPGNNWIVLDPNGMLDAPSGGGRARETLWGRGARTGLAPRGIQYTGNPNDWSFNISYPLDARNFLLETLLTCPFSVRARERCGLLTDMVAYSSPGMVEFAEVTNNDSSYDNPLASPDGTEADVKQQFAAVAALQVKVTPVTHDDISKQWADADFNKVISIGFFRCAGDCGPGKSEEDEFLAVSDRDSTPGYSGNPTARLYYTQDKGITWSSVPIDPFTAADATDVVFLGDRIVVFSPDKAPAYASYTDILNGVTAPNLWTTMTGFSAITSGNFPKAASAPDSQYIYMVGNGGRVWRSSDAGVSATLIDNAATTSNNLNAVDFQDKDVGFIGGNSGTLLRYYKGAITRLTVSDSNGTLSANINTVRTPPSRGMEVYLGTAGGEAWRSRNATATRPTWENLPIPLKGSGAITDFAFVGYKGYQLYIIQTNASNQSRILRDHAGGIGTYGTDIEAVGDFVTPSNFKYNSIAMANVNFGIVVGQIHETYGYIGNIRPN